MFIFCVSLTLYKLLDDRWETMEYSQIVAIFVTCLCRTRVWPKRAGVSVFAPDCLSSVTRGGEPFTDSSFIPHSGFLVAPGRRARGTRGCQWDHLWLAVGPTALGGTRDVRRGAWLSVAPVVAAGREVLGGPEARGQTLAGPSPAVRRPRLLPPGTPAPEISPLCFQKCPSWLLCSPGRWQYRSL